ncbi:MAG: Zn-dependent dipeptidase microsomal dipeptidase [Subtercola sp.]|nr:Zn-dependent dipeptidase microsomal dipeptidase [Subtercola sp.]
MSEESAENFNVEFRQTTYDGYRSFSYLTPGVDYDEFELAKEFGRVPLYDLGLDDEQHERTKKLIDDNIIISLHDHPTIFPANMDQVHDYIRTGREHTSYEGLSRSGMTAVFDNMMDGTACVTSKFGWKWDDIIYDLGMRLSDTAHQDYARIAYGVKDITEAKENGQIAIVLSLEAATPIENEVDRIDILYGLGIRQMGIAYSESNSLGSGLKEARDGGLTVFGRRAVERMNALGVAIDVSHSGDQTCLDTFEHSSKPVFITHAGARSVWETARMKPDSVLKACAETGGVIGLEAAPHTSLSHAHPEHSIESVMDHFLYCVDLMGIDHVAFGPDTLYGDHVALHTVFSRNLGLAQATHGPSFPRVEYVAGLDNPTENFYNIVGWLVKRGFSDEDIVKVTGGNIMRVLEQVW